VVFLRYVEYLLLHALQEKPMIHEARFKQFEGGDPTLCCDDVKKEIASYVGITFLVDPTKSTTVTVECKHCRNSDKVTFILVFKSPWSSPSSNNWVPKDYIDINEEPYIEEAKNDHRKSSHV